MFTLINNNTNSINKSPLVISYYLIKHCKLWVWDFDDTLIDTKYYYKSNMEPAAILKRTDDELTSEVPQWKYFKQVVEYLVKHGKYVGIASFGTYEIIQAYMDRILGFNQTFFKSRNIIAPIYQDRVCRRFKAPPNKNEYIYKMMKMYKIEDFKSVVLFDDLPSNIADGISVGIVAIQIATPSGGDSSNGMGGDKYGSGGVSYSGGNSNGDGIFFGPWVMDDFDKKIENDCGKELYLNKTYTGITNRYYQARKKKSDKMDNNDTPYKGISYDKTDFRNGIHESFSVPVAFGTGIGNRKITMSPEVRWNNMNVDNPPQWVNGNWEESTLGGTSSSYWDKHQKVMKSNDNDNDDKYVYNNINPIGINPYNGKLNEESNYVMGVTEGFTNTNSDNDSDDYDIKSKFGLIKKNGDNNDSDNDSDSNENCKTCKKLEWNWIILVLILIILIMTVIIYNVV